MFKRTLYNKQLLEKLSLRDEFIIDFTEIFEKEDVDKLYLPGRYGGHLTAYGNKIVAKTLIERGIIN